MSKEYKDYKEYDNTLKESVILITEAIEKLESIGAHEASSYFLTGAIKLHKIIEENQLQNLQKDFAPIIKKVSKDEMRNILNNIEFFKNNNKIKEKNE